MLTYLGDIMWYEMPHVFTDIDEFDQTYDPIDGHVWTYYCSYGYIMHGPSPAP